MAAQILKHTTVRKNQVYLVCDRRISTNLPHFCQRWSRIANQLWFFWCCARDIWSGHSLWQHNISILCCLDSDKILAESSVNSVKLRGIVTSTNGNNLRYCEIFTFFRQLYRNQKHDMLAQTMLLLYVSDPIRSCWCAGGLLRFERFQCA